MNVKVSVVVPVYNPGSHIDDCVASLLRQSLPSGDYEILFVDDGSTDGTGERLDALAGQHANVHLIHIANSGWPGRPRNIGMDAARGEYVYFVDNDDWLGDEALERMHAMAVRNGADIVIGKVVGQGRQIPRELFRRSIDDASLEKHPLLSMLTPHKLFRKAFLTEHDVRFPEGRRRLEDHLFVMKAYLAANVISVLSDYPCYHWVRREDDTNASRRPFEPRGYYDNVREVLDVVEEHVPAGAFRDSLLRHWYRGKMLGRLGGKKLLAYPPDYRRELFQEIRRLAEERFGSGVVAGLPANLRVRSRLLQAGRLDQLVALAERDSRVRADVHLTSVAWQDGALRIALSGHLVGADGSPVTYRRDGTRVCLDLGDLAEVSPEDRDVTPELRRSRLDVLVQSRDSSTEFLLPVHCKVETRADGGRVVVCLSAEARLEPLVAAAEAPLEAGVWDVFARVLSTGWDVSTRVGAAEPEQRAGPLHALVFGDPPRVVTPYWTKFGNLSVQVDVTMTAVPQARQRTGPVRVQVDPRAVVLTIRVPRPTEDLIPARIARQLRRVLNALPPAMRTRMSKLLHRNETSAGM